MDVAESLETLLGRPLARRHVDPRVGDVRDSQADNAQLRALFPTAAETSFDEGLSATYDWWRAAAER